MKGITYRGALFATQKYFSILNIMLRFEIFYVKI